MAQVLTSEFEDFFDRDITVWNTHKDERYGIITFGNPFLLKCFFTASAQRFNDSKGVEQVSKYEIILDELNGNQLKDTDYIYLDADMRGTPDPRTLEYSHEVKFVGVTAGSAIGTRDVYEIKV